MITTTQQINIQFGISQVRVQVIGKMVSFSSLHNEAKNYQDLENIDHSKPSVNFYFPTAESMTRVIDSMMNLQDQLRKAELGRELQEALDREIELAIAEDAQDLGDADDHDNNDEGCSCCADLNSEDEII